LRPNNESESWNAASCRSLRNLNEKSAAILQSLETRLSKRKIDGEREIRALPIIQAAAQEEGGGGGAAVLVVVRDLVAVV